MDIFYVYRDEGLKLNKISNMSDEVFSISIAKNTNVVGYFLTMKDARLFKSALLRPNRDND